MRSFVEKKRKQSSRTTGAQQGSSDSGRSPGCPDDLFVVTRVQMGAGGVPVEVEYGVMDGRLINWRSGPERIVATSLIQLLQSGRVVHCIFPTATGFALGPRLLPQRANGFDILVLEGGLEQVWDWRHLPQMTGSLNR